jgi:hypothetical protein
VLRLVERLRAVFERVPVELLRVRAVLLLLLRRGPLVLLRRVLLVRLVPLVLFWVAIGGNPSSAS